MPVTQTSPMGNFVSRAQRSPKNRCFLRGNAHYPLRRDVADSAFLQQTGFEAFASALRPDQDHRRAPTRTPNSFWHCSTPSSWDLRRINKTEILQYNGAFLEMLGLKRFPDQATLRRFLKRLPPKTIRQLGRLHDSLRAHLFALPHLSHHADVRHRFGRDHGVRQTARSASRIQPQEAWPTVLPSDLLFRSASARILAWDVPAGERRCRHRRPRLYPGLSRQSPLRPSRGSAFAFGWTRDSMAVR